MTLLTLRRDAPEVSGTRLCDLCASTSAAGRPMAHLLTGAPGAANTHRVLCRGCTAALVGLAREFAGDITLVVQAEDAGVANKLGMPAAHDPEHAGTRTAQAEVGAEMDRISDSVDGLRAQVDHLAALEHRRHP